MGRRQDFLVLNLLVNIVATEVHRVNSAETAVLLCCPAEVPLFNSTSFRAFVMNIAFYSTVKVSVQKRKEIIGLYINPA